MRQILALAGLTALAACSNPAATGNTTAVGGGTVASGGALLGPSWKGEEACTTLDKSAVAAAVGVDVTETKLDGVHTLADSPSALSSCYYTLKTGGMVALLTRQTPDSDNTPDTMKQMRDEVAGTMGPVEDVTGVGKSAFWIVKARQLDVFVGKDRYFNITMPADLGGKDPKTIALALATKLT